MIQICKPFPRGYFFGLRYLFVIIMVKRSSLKAGTAIADPWLLCRDGMAQEGFPAYREWEVIRTAWFYTYENNLLGEEKNE